MDDFRVSRLTDDFRVSSLEKINFYVLFFNCKTNLRLFTWKSKSQISDTIRTNTKLTRLSQTTYMEVVSIFFNKQRWTTSCKSSLKTHLKVNCKTNFCIDKKTSM
ncbi:hypothetical protein IGI04_034560 [Brassica rapa subsp. trilocularis]|uniref:F-box associated domain-containing protein n=1 Tax=Brassica rapa subsp. trilocularis TaxID=1813537 RepID=A0ABQ7LB55_BRACM|nr:hypothetical protein IGI04_034560 [Brassica rapa subsp. trilocularis]